MKKYTFVMLAAMFLLGGCAVGTGYYGEAVIVPALPTIVILEEEPYYYHSGYHYHYKGNHWYYSRSRGGPWLDLPRDRYPKEVRFKHRGNDRGRGDDRGRGEKRGHERHDGY